MSVAKCTPNIKSPLSALYALDSGLQDVRVLTFMSVRKRYAPVVEC